MEEKSEDLLVNDPRMSMKDMMDELDFALNILKSSSTKSPEQSRKSNNTPKIPSIDVSSLKHIDNPENPEKPVQSTSSDEKKEPNADEIFLSQRRLKTRSIRAISTEQVNLVQSWGAEIMSLVSALGKNEKNNTKTPDIDVNTLKVQVENLQKEILELQERHKKEFNQLEDLYQDNFEKKEQKIEELKKEVEELKKENEMLKSNGMNQSILHTNPAEELRNLLHVVETHLQKATNYKECKKIAGAVRDCALRVSTFTQNHPEVRKNAEVVVTRSRSTTKNFNELYNKASAVIHQTLNEIELIRIYSSKSSASKDIEREIANLEKDVKRILEMKLLQPNI